MRIALVTHGLPPHAVTGVETHTAALAAALARVGVAVEVFAPCFLSGLALFAQRREQRVGYGVTWVNVQGEPSDADAAAAFGAFVERERPVVVHFQHLSGLCFGALQEATRRGLATVFTAHDFHAARETYTLIRPDLVPFEIGDLESEARTRVARAWLSELPELGDHHGCVLPEQLDDTQAAHLAAILEGEAGAGLEEARGAARERAARVRQALGAVDAHFATSRYLARELCAPLGRAFVWRPAGVELKRFQGVAPPRRTERPLRFGFLGGLLKHKGVHMLLDAFGVLERQAELHIWGASGDRAYVEILRERADEVGAVWHGTCHAAELAEVFATFDVLVVPSLWIENAPFVIREAFAARRPVITFETETLRESVRADEDGLLVSERDAASLARSMQRIIDEEWLLDRLELGIQTPKDIDAEAREWADTYDEILRERASEAEVPELPVAVEALAQRYQAAAALPTRELFDYVTRGLTRLGERMGLSGDPSAFLTSAIGRGARLRDDIADGQRAVAWLTDSVDAAAEARAELEERSGWYAEQLQALERKVRWLEEQSAGRADEVASLTAERDWFSSARDGAAEELSAVRGELAGVEDERDWQRETLAAADAARAALEAERDWIHETAEHHALELRWLHARVTGRDPEVTPNDEQGRVAIEEHLGRIDAEFEALHEHERWLRSELTGLAGELTEQPATDAPLDTEPLTEAVATARVTLARLREELDWRRAEMRAVRDESSSLIARLRGGVAQRARRWEESS